MEPPRAALRCLAGGERRRSSGWTIPAATNAATVRLRKRQRSPSPPPHGLPVLPGFVVTTSATREIADAGLAGVGLARSTALGRSCAADGARPLVVRSSSTVEDGGTTSMAGVFALGPRRPRLTDFVEAISDVLRLGQVRAWNRDGADGCSRAANARAELRWCAVRRRPRDGPARPPRRRRRARRTSPSRQRRGGRGHYADVEGAVAIVRVRFCPGSQVAPARPNRSRVAFRRGLRGSAGHRVGRRDQRRAPIAPGASDHHTRGRSHRGHWTCARPGSRGRDVAWRALAFWRRTCGSILFARAS